MKQIAALASLTLVLTATMSCEKHSWENTKMFNQNRHAAGHGGEHGAAPHGSAESHSTHEPKAETGTHAAE